MIANPFRLAVAPAIFACAVISSFAAGAPRFYPAANAPLSAEPFLVKIENAFPSGTPQLTLKYPLPATGARLATADEFLAALHAAVTADPGHVADMVLAARRAARISDGSPSKRPIIPDVGDLILNAGAVAAAVPHLGEVLDALLAEDPADAKYLTLNVLKAAAIGGAAPAALTPMARAGAAALANGFKPADAPYQVFAQAVLTGAITADLTGGNNGARAAAIVKGMIQGIQDRGLETPLLDDVVRGSARAYGTMPDVTLADIATAAFTEATPSRNHAILISAACVVGVPFFYLDTPVDQVVATAGAGALPAFTNAIAVAAKHALKIRLTELRIVGSETLKRILTDGTANSDAIVCAALMASPTKSYDTLRAGFDGTYGPDITPPRIAFPEWVRISLSGNPKFAADALVLVLDRGNSEGLFVGGITPADATASVLTATSPLSTTPVIDALKKLIAAGGASDVEEDAGKLSAALEASPQPIEIASIVAPLLTGTISENAATLKKLIVGATGPDFRGAITAAAVLADPANTSPYTTAALGADSSAADDAAISAAVAGTQLGLVAGQPKWRVSQVARSLVTSHPSQTRAVVLGELLAVPKQPLAILVAAMSGDPAFDLEKARPFDPADSPSLALAEKIAAAEVANAADPGTTLAMLFDAVDSAVLAHHGDILNLTAAATMAAPRYAHHTLHAAAFRYPSVALRTVETVFDAAPIATPGDQTARAAALGAALINGLREARTGTYAANEMRLAIGAAVKSARGFTGPAVATSNGAVNRSTLTTSNGPAAVMTGVASQFVVPEDTSFRGAFLLATAVSKAPGHGLAIAQAVAQATVSIAGAKLNTDTIVSAVAAGGSPFSTTQIRNAAAFGKLKARLGVPGAGATGVRNYQHHSGTTNPVPSLDVF